MCTRKLCVALDCSHVNGDLCKRNCWLVRIELRSLQVVTTIPTNGVLACAEYDLKISFYIFVYDIRVYFAKCSDTFSRMECEVTFAWGEALSRALVNIRQ
jgi:hypothetical protein